VACKARISEDCAQHIAEWHGRHALAIAHAASLDDRLREPICDHSSHLVAEAVEAVVHESAITLGDILLRRVPVALGACWSHECTRDAAERIGAAVGWDHVRIGNEIESMEEEREKFLHPKSVSPNPSAVIPLRA
jgi:glycerol-3-phosphate dehydrogenase